VKHEADLALALDRFRTNPARPADTQKAGKQLRGLNLFAARAYLPKGDTRTWDFWTGPVTFCALDHIRPIFFTASLSGTG
jgi:hypothetical protein